MHDAADDALLAAMAAGDADAAVVFVRRFQARVFGVANAVLGDRDRADDVAQEAFVRAWRHGDSFDPRRGSVISWLLAITRNLAIDQLRAQRLRPADHLEAVIAEVAARDPDPATVAALDDERRRVVERCGRSPRSSGGRCCSPRSAAARRRRSASWRTSRSARPRPASAPACAGCGGLRDQPVDR